MFAPYVGYGALRKGNGQTSSMNRQQNGIFAGKGIFFMLSAGKSRGKKRKKRKKKKKGEGKEEKEKEAVTQTGKASLF
jgi:hypothetical protein